jgi:hypothetical protein
MRFIEPPYTIYTVIGEEHIHFDFFLKIIKYDLTVVRGIAFITLCEENDNKTFWMRESEWLSIQRELKISKLLEW